MSKLFSIMTILIFGYATALASISQLELKAKKIAQSMPYEERTNEDERSEVLGESVPTSQIAPPVNFPKLVASNFSTTSLINLLILLAPLRPPNC